MVNFSNPYISNNYRIIPNITTAGSIEDASPVVTQQPSQGNSFANLLSDAMTNTVSSDAGAKEANLGLMVGETQDLHSLTIASEKADIMLNLTVQIRDRMVEAYQEVMRMQI